MLKKVTLLVLFLLIFSPVFSSIRTPSSELLDEYLSKCREKEIDECEVLEESDFDEDGIVDCEIRGEKCWISEEKESALDQQSIEEIKSFHEQRQAQEFTILLLYFGLPIIGLALLRWKIKSEKWKNILLSIIIVLIILKILLYVLFSQTLY